MTQIVRDVGAVVLAVVLIVVFCLVVLYQVVNGKPINIPDSLLVLVSAVVAFFLGEHATSSGAANSQTTAANTAAQIVSQTNAANGKSTP